MYGNLMVTHRIEENLENQAWKPVQTKVIVETGTTSDSLEPLTSGIKWSDNHFQCF